MPRITYVYRDGKWVEKTPETSAPEERKSAYVIQDSMESTWHPVDGKQYDSKSSFRKTTKASGCTEMGNEKPKLYVPKRTVSREDIKREVAKVVNDYLT
jgi:DNA mismatch repair ATPase MutL